MAPPANRRSGNSRRAQYSAFLGVVACVVGAGLGALLLIASLAERSAYGWLRALGSDITAPAARTATTLRSTTSSLGDMLAGYATWGPENARLRREVALARVRLVGAAADADENRRLKALLGLSAAAPRPVATAWLIASSGSSVRRYAVISAGAAQGVQQGMPVRSPLGLVGRVLEVGRVSARVLLITDSESIVPVRRASDGLPGFASGRADGTLQLRLLTMGINPLKPGDAFVTSGSGGLFWPGTPIAVVGQLTHDGAIGRVLADPAASEMVVVQPEWNPAADTTLPPPLDTAPPKPKAKPKGKGKIKIGAKPGSRPR